MKAVVRWNTEFTIVKPAAANTSCCSPEMHALRAVLNNSNLMQSCMLCTLCFETQICCCHCAEQVPAHSSAQLAGHGVADGVADEQTLVEMGESQDTSLEVAGFAGTVAEAYASYSYV